MWWLGVLFGAALLVFAFLGPLMYIEAQETHKMEACVASGQQWVQDQCINTDAPTILDD